MQPKQLILPNMGVSASDHDTPTALGNMNHVIDHIIVTSQNKCRNKKILPECLSISDNLFTMNRIIGGYRKKGPAPNLTDAIQSVRWPLYIWASLVSCSVD